MRALLLLVVFLLGLIPSLETAYCGTSAIPYSFEVLPDGSTSLGCARPSCFGYDPATGNWASQDSNFNQAGGHPDGYLRTSDQVQRAPFFTANPQTSACFSSASCLRDQWAAGYDASSSGLSLICCAYPLLSNSQDLGTAVLRPGEIAVGGENQGSFDYIRNVQVFRSASGQVERYDVEMGRFPCAEPMAIQAAVEAVAPPQQQVVAPAQTYYQPAAPAYNYYGGGGGGYADFRCFTGDSMVTLSDGSSKRMDELSVGDWVKATDENLFRVQNMPVESWLHRLPEKETEFIVLKTEGGKTIKLTEDHYLYKTQCNVTGHKKPEMVRAADVILGDCLLEAVYKTGSFLTTKVVEITTSVETGIYAPLTDGGKIIVNGLMASCFSDTKNEVIVQTLRERLVNCDAADGLDSLQCSLGDNKISLLLDMLKFALPEGMSW